MGVVDQGQAASTRTVPSSATVTTTFKSSESSMIVKC
jgi:hypothetical protein